VRVLAPAKVNLGLAVVGRRADGYHELESVFAPLDLADALDVEIEVARAAATSVALAVEGEGAGVPAGPENLAARAAHAFLDAAGVRARVRIALAKRIPAAAGLGGGSSDAGAVLRALAAGLPGALAPAALARVALTLGADVPFFLDPRPALVSGVGERRAPLPGALPPLPLVLANPGTPLSTARVFAAYAASGAPPSPPGRLAARLRDALGAPPGALPARLAALVENDLEPAAEALCPALGPLRDALRSAGALAVGLSGSGATLYGVFPSAPAAAAALAGGGLGPGAWARVARTLEAG
jgi:4-diphosphocytidyl-2-C-methyl-D-erythritol kinase